MEEEEWSSIFTRIRQGDQAAVHQVLEWLDHLDQRAGKWHYRNSLRKRGVPEQNLEDAVAELQKVVLAQLAAGKFRGNSRGEFVKYIIRICQTIARDYRMIPGPDLELWRDVTAPNPETTVRLRRELEAALAQVPKRYGEAWILSYKGYDFPEIAIYMNCSCKRAKKLVSEARLAIRDWMNFFGIVVDIHLTPSSPRAGQQVESWVHVENNGYGDVQGLWVALRVDKHRLGRQKVTEVLRHCDATVRGFTPWTRRQGRQTLLATWRLGKKEACKTQVVEDV
jgi:DNA-directed RNA polymerase specialized sigma24 family protein